MAILDSSGPTARPLVQTRQPRVSPLILTGSRFPGARSRLRRSHTRGQRRRSVTGPSPRAATPPHSGQQAPKHSPHAPNGSPSARTSRNEPRTRRRAEKIEKTRARARARTPQRNFAKKFAKNFKKFRPSSPLPHSSVWFEARRPPEVDLAGPAPGWSGMSDSSGRRLLSPMSDSPELGPVSAVSGLPPAGAGGCLVAFVRCVRFAAGGQLVGLVLSARHVRFARCGRIARCVRFLFSGMPKTRTPREFFAWGPGSRNLKIRRADFQVRSRRFRSAARRLVVGSLSPCSLQYSKRSRSKRGLNPRRAVSICRLVSRHCDQATCMPSAQFCATTDA